MKKPLDQLESGIDDLLFHSIFDAIHDGVIVSDLETGLVVKANKSICIMHGYAYQEIIGSPLSKLFQPDNQFTFDAFVKTLQPNQTSFIQTLQRCSDGTMFHVEWSLALFNFQGRSCLVGSLRDISKRIQAEKKLNQNATIRAHEQATLLAISHTLASTLELQPGLILDQLREIIEYNHAGLFSLEETALITLSMKGAPSLEKSIPIRIQLSDSTVLKALFKDHHPIRIADAWADDPKSQSLRLLLNNGASVLLEGMHSWMWVPLAVKSRVIGAMGVAHKTRDFFTSHHADLALSVANQAAITMFNAELYGHAQELAVLEERQRLARNLHDAVNQSLFSAGLIAEVLPRLWERDQNEAQHSLEDLRKLMRGAMAEMRALLAELRPSTLTDAKFGDLLHLLSNSFTGRTNIPSILSVNGQGVLPAEVQVAIYRLSQEALNNVAKHAEASKVEIILEQDETSIELTIRDDGKGFDKDQMLSGHYGLSMMRERAEAIGAQLSILSQVGLGTELTLRWKESREKEVL